MLRQSVCLIFSTKSEDTSINCSCSLKKPVAGFLTCSSLTDVLSILLKNELHSLWSSESLSSTHCGVFTIFTAGVHRHQVIRDSNIFPSSHLLSHRLTLLMKLLNLVWFLLLYLEKPLGNDLKYLCISAAGVWVLMSRLKINLSLFSYMCDFISNLLKIIKTYGLSQ